MRAVKNVLAFDTALFGCVAAVWQPDTDRAVQESVPMSRGQAEELVPMVERVMAQAGVPYDALDLIGTTIGPGAFTGLRIGLSAARAFGLALGIPVVGVSTLDVLARQYFHAHLADPDARGQLAVLIETKRQDFYIQRYDIQGFALSEPAALTAAEIVPLWEEEPVTLIGDGVPRFQELVPFSAQWHHVEGFGLADPVMIARLATQDYVHAPPNAVFAPPSPLYLREADVTMPKKPPRVMVAK